MNEIMTKDKFKIGDMIYEVRGMQVMLDFDLAIVYECTNGTKSINLAVKRHIDRFPERFMFQLKENEYENLRFQIETSSFENEYGGRRYLPYAFTEQGVAMLATVLRSKKAVETSIRIMDAFVKMRHFIKNNSNVYESINRIDNKLVEHDEKFDYLFSKFDKGEQLFLENNEYGAYSSFVDIFKLANKELIIVDSYADNTLLDIIRKIKCNIILITKDSCRLSNNEINRYNRQYHNLNIVRNNSFHDRYFIIDKKFIYQSGTSINNAGNKIFSINKLEDNMVKNTILECISKIIN